MLDVSSEEITDGPIARTLVVLAAPLVAQNFVLVAQQVIDTFWVGRLGEDAVAAVGLNFPIIAFVSAVPILTYVGTQVVASQRVGDEDTTGAQRAVFHGLTLAVALTVLVAAPLVVGAGTVVDLVGSNPGVLPLAATYLGTWALGLPFMGVSDTLEAGFVGWGDSRASLYVNVTAVVVNVILDPILILDAGRVPGLGTIPLAGLGIRGAALATVIGFGTGALLAVGLSLGPRDTLTLTRESIAFRSQTYREIADVGSPAAGQQLVAQFVRVVIVGIVSVVGGAAGLAAYTVGARIATVSFVPATGLRNAVQSMIGQNLGANRPSRAVETVRVGIGIAVGAMIAIGLAQWVIPGALTRLFVPDITPRGFELTVAYLRILAYGYWAIGATYVLLAGFNGARRTRTSLVVDLVKYWGLRFPVAVLALPAGAAVSLFGISIAPGVGLGMEAIFWAVTGSNILAALGVGAYFVYTVNDGMFHRAAERASTDSDAAD